jgi:hypothetical protein
MSKVVKLVKSYLAEGEDTESSVGQTVTLNLRARAQLEALAQIAKLSKTRTASQVLIEALADAIEALPDEPIIRAKFMHSGNQGEEVCTPQEYVALTLADWAYQDRLESGGLLPDERLYTPEEADQLTGQKVGQA